MAEVIRSPRARNDIKRVLQYTIKKWGEAQAWGTGRNARHVLFYRIGVDGTVEIIRLLHDSMDFERHLP